MRKVFIIAFLFILPAHLFAQTAKVKLQQAYRLFEQDAQLRHAISSLYVIDAATGAVVFEKNAAIGLAPASTQKIITAASAFELLGSNYQYKTEIGYDGQIDYGILNGNIYISGTGDPTLGSSRWSATRDTVVFGKWKAAVQKAGIKTIQGTLQATGNMFSAKIIPDGWIWQDIGNYYGAGASVLNWKENQYTIELRSGEKAGSNVEVISSKKNFTNELKTGAKGSGDNAYVYYDDVIAGTIPAGERSFPVSASRKDPGFDLLSEFSSCLDAGGIAIRNNNAKSAVIVQSRPSMQVISTHYSPGLDSIVYWFLQKSVNLFGEAFVKTIAAERGGIASTDSGVAIIRRLWKQKGIDEEELSIGDGSGLSPQNRVTTHAQVEILKYAKKQSWFPAYYAAFPKYNNMKMKSGTISRVKGFCGYHKSKDGKEYIFSFLVNNYSGTSSQLVDKMYKVLDGLK